MNNPWFNLLPAQGKNVVRLYCLPYAGASHSVFQHWQRFYEEDIELALVKYPGRGARYLAPLHDNLQHLVSDLAKTIALDDNKPFALFGHSMGSLIAFELAHHLKENYGLSALALFVSGGTAPSLRHKKKTIHNLSANDFSEKVIAMNGIPEEIATNPELMNFFLPILRHDFTLYEQHIYRKRPPLDCPITVFGGRGDPNINEHHLMGWKQETKQAFTLKWFDGDHFFLFQHERLLADIIRKAVTPELFTLTS